MTSDSIMNLPDGIETNNLSVEQNLKEMIRILNDEHNHNIKRTDFKYDIILSERKIDQYKIKQWMCENLDGKTITVWDGGNYEYHFFFEKDYDAMGFRLLWEFD